MDLNSIFDGIGTEIIILIITVLFCGVGATHHKIKKKKIIQKQNAKDNANQTQIVNINNNFLKGDDNNDKH